MATETAWPKVLIKEPVGWKGQFYPKGLQKVPPDLAQALGYDLNPDEPAPVDPAITPEQLISDRIDELRLLYFGESGEEANWRPIHQLGQAYGIAKPANGWDGALEAIATYEQEQGMLPVAD